MVASVVQRGNNDEAYNLIVQFSKLVRKNMKASGEIFTTLTNEIDFVQDYLSIQKFRFKGMFDFNIAVEKGIDSKIKIPKLLIQVHVENALKHGIRPSQKKGELKILVSGGQKGILIEVEDNGVGRQEAMNNNTEGDGIGLQAINELIGINNQHNKTKIQQEIIDLKDTGGEALGTKIVLRISV